MVTMDASQAINTGVCLLDFFVVVFVSGRLQCDLVLEDIGINLLPWTDCFLITFELSGDKHTPPQGQDCSVVLMCTDLLYFILCLEYFCFVHFELPSHFGIGKYL